MDEPLLTRKRAGEDMTSDAPPVKKLLPWLRPPPTFGTPSLQATSPEGITTARLFGQPIQLAQAPHWQELASLEQPSPLVDVSDVAEHAPAPERPAARKLPWASHAQTTDQFHRTCADSPKHRDPDDLFYVDFEGDTKKQQQPDDLFFLDSEGDDLAVSKPASSSIPEDAVMIDLTDSPSKPATLHIPSDAVMIDLTGDDDPASDSEALRDPPTPPTARPTASQFSKGLGTTHTNGSFAPPSTSFTFQHPSPLATQGGVTMPRTNQAPASPSKSQSAIAEMLPIPISVGNTIKPRNRVLARNAAPVSTIRDVKRISGKAPAVDPRRLPPGKKARYYVLWQGGRPGIYYSMQDLEKQLSGYRSIWEAFKTPAEVNEYVHHQPEDCEYNACYKDCKLLAKESRKGGYKGWPGSTCKCCGKLVYCAAMLCPDCFDQPAVWLNKVIESHGLASEQEAAIRSAAEGQNVFFTGAAGTGKSTLIRALIHYMKGLNVSVEPIAHSGIAALNIEGRTVASFAGWDPSTDKTPIEGLFERARKGAAPKRMRGTDVLIIDEISMVENNCFTRLSQIMQSLAMAAKAKHGSSRSPFGGVQVICSGDFYQLPPVKPMENCVFCGQDMVCGHGDQRRCLTHGEVDFDDRFAFASPVWHACVFNMIELKRIHRQADVKFTSILAPLRKGYRLNAAQERILYDHPVTITRDEATKLVPTRVGAARINDDHIRRIRETSIVTMAVDTFAWDRAAHPDLGMLSHRTTAGESGPLRVLEDLRFPFRLEMKRSMLVLLITNLDRDKGLVNGAIGKIIDFVDMTDDNMPRADTEKAKKPSRNQSNDGDESGRKQRGPVIHGDHSEFKANQIRHFRDRLPPGARKWPVVVFKNGQKATIYANCSVSERGSSKPPSLLSRTQLPLLPGYAITIHASQGMTLESVVVDLARCWEAGQAYVALSRAKSLEGLIVDTLPTRVPFDPIVEDFMVAAFGEDDDGPTGADTPMSVQPFQPFSLAPPASSSAPFTAQAPADKPLVGKGQTLSKRPPALSTLVAAPVDPSNRQPPSVGHASSKPPPATSASAPAQVQTGDQKQSVRWQIPSRIKPDKPDEDDDYITKLARTTSTGSKIKGAASAETKPRAGADTVKKEPPVQQEAGALAELKRNCASIPGIGSSRLKGNTTDTSTPKVGTSCLKGGMMDSIWATK